PPRARCHRTPSSPCAGSPPGDSRALHSFPTRRSSDLPGLLPALLAHLKAHGLQLASIMATLPMGSPWERLLVPPFVYFFKLLYPFALANSPRSRVAAAAGGCILLETAQLRAIGGFAALRDALIDDCTLARLVKAAGGRTWLGLSRDVVAVRPYERLQDIWNMVAR